MAAALYELRRIFVICVLNVEQKMYVANRGNEWKYVNLTAAYFRFQVISPLRLPPQGWVINSFFLEYSEGCLVPDHFFRLNNWLVKAKRMEICTDPAPCNAF